MSEKIGVIGYGPSGTISDTKVLDTKPSVSIEITDTEEPVKMIITNPYHFLDNMKLKRPLNRAERRKQKRLKK